MKQLEAETNRTESAAAAQEENQSSQGNRPQRNPRIVIGNLEFFVRLMEEDEQL